MLRPGWGFTFQQDNNQKHNSKKKTQEGLHYNKSWSLDLNPTEQLWRTWLSLNDPAKKNGRNFLKKALFTTGHEAVIAAKSALTKYYMMGLHTYVYGIFELEMNKTLQTPVYTLVIVCYWV